MIISERIKMLRNKYALSQKKLSKLLDVSEGAVTKWESGKATPSVEQIYKLSKEFGVTSDYLLGLDESGQSEIANKLSYMYETLDNETKEIIYNLVLLYYSKNESNKKSRQSLNDALSDLPSKYIKHFLLKTSAESSSVINEYESEMIPAEGDVPIDADFCLSLSGKSMEPYIGEDELVYVNKTDNIKTGDIGIFSINGDVVCKLFIKNMDGSVILASTNQDYSNSNILISPKASSELICYGKVLLNESVGIPEYLYRTAH